MKGKLFDASALVNIMVNRGSETTKLLRNNMILDLTVYEVGNTIWKLCYLEKKISYEQACKFLNSFLTLLDYMDVLSINGIEENVKNLSVEEGMTFYDASYLAVAENKDLILVTDDAMLAKVASKVKAIPSDRV